MTPPRAAILYLRLETTAGNSDEQIAHAMVTHVARFGVPVLVDFNGADLLAWPGETAEEVVARWWDQR